MCGPPCLQEMHTRNIYRDREKTDFTILAESYPPLSAHLTRASSIDFRNKKSILTLTQAFLSRDFNLTLSMPEDDRLIPPIPQKLNYILWLEDLFGNGRDHKIRGIDIGTGSSCVYPLIGARKNGWEFLATEIDEVSKEYAERNVRDNKLGHLIDVRLVGREDVLCGVMKDESDFSFCMCNPPFFGSEDEASGKVPNRTERRPQAKTECSGTQGERVTEGGELTFVRSIVSDSMKLQTRIRWYTSMLGKKSSVRPLVEELECQGVKVTTTKFVQGKTHRWAIGWTFHESSKIPLEVKTALKRPAQRPLSFSVHAHHLGMSAVTEQLLSILRELQISTTPDTPHRDKDGGVRFTCTAHQNTWIHSRRRRRAVTNSKLKDTTSVCQQTPTPGEEISSILECHVTIKPVDGPSEKKAVSSEREMLCVEMEWIDGENRDLMNQLLVHMKNQICKQIL